ARSDGTIIISTTDAQQRIFQPDSRYPGVYFAKPGDYGTISSVNGRSLVLQEADGTQIAFNADGRVASITDTNGNRITATYTGANLTKLTHSSGEWLELDYNAAGRIVQLLDHDGRKTTFAYDASNQHLMSVTEFDGRTMNYEYVNAPGTPANNAMSMAEG